MSIYAVIKTGGKQYRVSPGDVLKVEKLPIAAGGSIEISDVFLFVNGADVAVGNPTVAAARVIAELVEEGRGEKIRIFKKRRRKHYQKSMGHRQSYSAIRINEIVHGDKRYKADGADNAQVDDNGARSSTPVAGASPMRADVSRSPSPNADERKARPATAPAPVTVPPAPLPPSTVDATAAPKDAAIDERTPVPSPVRAEPPVARVEENAGRNFPDAVGLVAPTSRAAVPDVSAPKSSFSIPVPDPENAAARTDTPPDSNELYWSLAVLLALLLGGAGWMLSDDEAATEQARVDPAPAPVNAVPVKHVSEPPPVPDVKVRKPARAAKPSAPVQPPD